MFPNAAITSPGSFRYGMLLRDKSMLFPDSSTEPSVQREFDELNQQFPNFSNDLPVDRRRDIPLSWFNNIEWIESELTIRSDTTEPIIYYLEFNTTSSSTEPFIHIRKKNRLDRVVEWTRGNNVRGTSKLISLIEFIRAKRGVTQIPNGRELDDYD
jgi:hypothetical protein